MIVAHRMIKTTQSREPRATARIVSVYLRWRAVKLDRFRKCGIPIPVFPIARIETLNLSSVVIPGSWKEEISDLLLNDTAELILKRIKFTFNEHSSTETFLAPLSPFCICHSIEYICTNTPGCLVGASQCNKTPPSSALSLGLATFPGTSGRVRTLIMSVIGSAEVHVRRYILYREFGGNGFSPIDDLLAFLWMERKGFIKIY